jgi:hypothetical protein
MPRRQPVLEAVKLGDKVRAFPHGEKTRLVTKLHYTETDESRWFSWGGRSGVHDARSYVLMPPDTPVDHSVSWM